MNDLSERIGNLEGTIENIRILGDDKEHTFDLVSNSGETNHVTKDEKGVINIQGASDALHIHEIKHVALSLASKDGMQFNSNGYLKPTSGYGIPDEIAGYRAQYAFDPSSLSGFSGNYNSIDVEYIANVKDSSGSYVYQAIHDAWVDFQNQQRKLLKGKKQ